MMSGILHLGGNRVDPARTGTSTLDMSVTCEKPALNRAYVYVRAYTGDDCAMTVAQQNEIMVWAPEGVFENVTYT